MTEAQQVLAVISALIACTTTLGGILISMVRKDARIESKVDRVIHALESEHSGSPGLLARQAKLEAELKALREWALSQGYERRGKSGDERA